MRLQPPSWEYGHPRQWIGVRAGSGIWLVVLTAIWCGHGYWWGVLLLAPAGLLFYLAYRLGTPSRVDAQHVARR
jgi:hypothetical protein